MKIKKKFFVQLKKTKYLLLSIFYLEFPKKSLEPFVTIATKDNIDNLASNYCQNICWITWKNPKLNRSHFKDYKSFILNNKEFTFVFVDDEIQEYWINNIMGNPHLANVFNASKFSVMKADIFRFAILYKYGGIVISINMVYEGKLKDINLNKPIISFYNKKYQYSNESKMLPTKFNQKPVIAYLLSGPPGHNLYKMMIDSIIDESKTYFNKIISDPKYAIWELLSPYGFTRVLSKYLDSYGDQDIIWKDFEFEEKARYANGHRFRYALEPSYLGSRNAMILWGNFE